MNEGAKKQLVQTGFFTGIVIMFFLILSLFSVLGRKNWERGLRAAAEDVLPADEWQCGKLLKIESNFSVSAACFELSKKNEGSKKFRAVIVRIASYLGPLPAVFVCKDGKAEFMGIAYFKTSLSQAFVDGKDDRQLLYWKGVAEGIALEAEKAGAEK
ncbi:MAG: hypothetical protein IJR40_05700 [Treponema sp.]|nr:hypothetical protein [Treponema sp.]MBQ7620579.1 hypothetical protein [Treponema sp.]MBQ9626654.1 hypothetical protein [Treponema sp.]